MMLLIENLRYIHPDNTLLFENLNLIVKKGEKIALTGNNGTGKSTLLKIIAGELEPAGGYIRTDTLPGYMPQIIGQYDHYTVAQALGVEEKINALNALASGLINDEYYHKLNDDWSIEERCREALDAWQLQHLGLDISFDRLSGGQQTRVFLAGIQLHQHELVLLDEPSNHLDAEGRRLLYDFIRSYTGTLVVVSHDRALLNLMDTTCELSAGDIRVYGGNYDFYREQKALETQALHNDIQEQEKALRKAREVQREAMERKQRTDSRGEKKHLKEGLPRVMRNTMRNHAEYSGAKLRNVHNEKIGSIAQGLDDLRLSLPGIEHMKFGFGASGLHRGKILVKAEQVNAGYHEVPLWKEPLDLLITSGERMVIRGSNGSGKTTLIRLILGELEPVSGTIYRADSRSVYIDQNYSLIDPDTTVYEQAKTFSTGERPDHEIRRRLTWFLFDRDDWDKPCSALSGGERMRLTLCCLTLYSQAPDLIVLDEPTNNLDIQNIEILTAAIRQYKGTLIVVSHDERFVEEIGADRKVELANGG